ncbi:hypothetical protein [uncultured Acetobacteroides sp.]|uniref:hypothetical protein n=1 Tax=uncultured Acetobacteroides sp. TaxID=1760811 RepID=UPI0029F4BCC9|nr:hypothetical protein [uncultured Acetobacteroides sp.]
MELHHHSNLGHGFKGWKPFLWEFLMLFLAVFAASLAEYQLEHKIERDREKQYIKSLVVDLAADTTNLNKAINDIKEQNSRLDTVLARFDQLSVCFNDTLIRNISLNYVDFIYTDRTMQQLKNSGAMRLIRDQSVADSILDYDSAMKHLMNSGQPIIQYMVLHELMPIYYKLIDMKGLTYSFRHKKIAQLRKENKTFLISNDKSKLVELSNYLLSYRSACSTLKDDEIRIKKQATKLIKQLKEEYKLE